MAKEKKSLYANIHAKKARIEKGSDEKMRKVGSKDAPEQSDFDKASKRRQKKIKNN